MLLFVYGTLKRGHGNNRILQSSEYVTDAVTREPFVLLRTGFPVMMREPNIGFATRHWLPVQGEVWNIRHPEVWARLDGLEGVPHMYTRGKTIVQFPTLEGAGEGPQKEVETYLGNPDMWYRRFNGKNYQESLCAVRDGAYLFE